MLRNKEFRRIMMIMLSIILMSCILTYLFYPPFLMLMLLSNLLLFGAFLLFSHHRYLDIKNLSSYLRRIYSGDYSLDIRDNEEGELSILRNEIYKVTLILSSQAQQLKKEKEQLADALSDISHQLKTPLTSMTVMNDLMGNEALSADKRKEFSKNLEIQLERMQWLLTSLLKLSKIDAGTILFKKDCVPISRLLEQALKPLLIAIEVKNIKLILEGSSDSSLIGDERWSIEAIVNVLKNCVEHTPAGGEIHITYQENPICSEIKIKDSGAGIPTEDIPYIFKRFYRGKNANEDSVGIGLAMAKSILLHQNGDIYVRNTKNDGVEFIIKFFKQIY